MTDAEYQDAQHLLAMIGQIALSIDLDAFLSRIDEAHAVGPILDPTLYRQAAGKLEQVREIANAVKRVQVVARQHAEASHG